MTDLLKEVDDALRRERMEKFWIAHGRKVIIGLALLLAAVGLFSTYEHWQRGVQESHTASLIALLESPDFPLNAREGVKDLAPGQRGLALLQAAARYRQEKKNDQALEIYQAVAAENAIPKTLRQQADLMRAAMLPQDVRALLTPIAEDQDSPLRPHALLNLAAYYAQEGGDLKLAQKNVQTVLEMANLPPSLMQRAQALAHVYNVQQPETRAKKEDDHEKG